MAGRIEVHAIDLPGRGKRRLESCIDDWCELVVLLSSELRPLVRQPYALLGYSLGALVALEVARALTSSAEAAKPRALIACALSGPASIRHERLLHRLDDKAMFEALRDLGGVPDELLASPELIALSAPSMRADLRLFETYGRPGAPLSGVPIFAYHGLADASVGEDFKAWRHETEAGVRYRAFEGGHMFIHDSTQALAEALLDDVGGGETQVRTA